MESGRRPQSILFCCTFNAVRSPMAEAIARYYYGREIYFASAGVKDVKAATEQDYGTEWLAPVVSIAVVENLDAAMEHIARFGSQHTDAIVTENWSHAQRFLREVDSASVMVNASTRFADGFEYGLGAEIGISTNKLHARGPVGLEGLTSQKWIVLGEGHVRT